MPSKQTLTYGRLRSALGELGYEPDPARSDERYTILTRPGGVVPIYLPVFPPRTAMRPIYLSMVRQMLDEERDDVLDRFEVMIRTDPSTWAVAGVAPPAAGADEPLPATVVGAAKVRRKPPARKAPPAG